MWNFSIYLKHILYIYRDLKLENILFDANKNIKLIGKQILCTLVMSYVVSFDVMCVIMH